MSSFVVPLILLAALLHAVWNALVKSSTDRLLTQAQVIGVASLIGLALVPFVPLPDRSCWPYLGVSALLHGGYCSFLVRAYRYGDLSHVYPLARGAAPLLVAGFAAAFAAETLTAVEAIGVVLVSCGIVSLGLFGGGPGTGRAVGYALVTGLFIAGYSVVDGMGVRRAGTESGFIAWNFLLTGLPILIIAAVVRGRRAIEFHRRNWRRGLLGGTIAALAYAIVIWAMSFEGMAHVIALRETSVVIAALIGTHWLGERAGRTRLIAVLLVASGNLLLRLAS